MRRNMKRARKYRVYAGWMGGRRALLWRRAHVKTPRPMLRRGVRVEYPPRAIRYPVSVAGTDSSPG